MRQMTWEDWNPYRGVNPRDIAAFLVICLFVSLVSEYIDWSRWRKQEGAGKRKITRGGRISHQREAARQSRRGIWVGITFFYVYTIFCATILGRTEGREPEIRTRLFWTLKAALETGNWLYWYYIVGNILLFVPLGITLMHLLVRRKKNGKYSYGRSFLCTVCLCFLLSALIEGIQYVTGTGLCEADDLLHNTLGGALGGGGYWIFMLYADS